MAGLGRSFSQVRFEIDFVLNLYQKPMEKLQWLQSDWFPPLLILFPIKQLSYMTQTRHQGGPRLLLGAACEPAACHFPELWLPCGERIPTSTGNEVGAGCETDPSPLTGCACGECFLPSQWQLIHRAILLLTMPCMQLHLQSTLRYSGDGDGGNQEANVY